MVSHYKDLIAAYFREYPLVQANITSFNDFIEKSLQRIVDEIGDITPTIIPQEVESFVIKLKKIWIEKPTIIEADGSKRDLYPTEARLRGLTYSAPIYLEVSAYIDDVQRESFTSMIGRLPIMLKSKYCHLNSLKHDELVKYGEDPEDPGGYFIINGNERVLINVEDLASNKVFIEHKGTGPSEYAARLFSEMGSYRIPHLLEQMKDGIFYLSFTRFRRVPIFAIIKSLGLVKDQDIVKLICGDAMYDSIFVNLYEVAEIKNEEQALDYLAKKIGISQTVEGRLEKTREQIDKYLLPHLGLTEKDRLAKAHNLCKFVRRFLVTVEENKQLPDKDHYMNKRLKLSGDLLEDLMRSNMRSLVQDILYNFQRLVKRGKFQSIRIIIRDELLTSNIKSALATGTWTGGRKGVSQNMERTNVLATYSHLLRVVSLLTSTQENFEARALHPTHWGRLCFKKDTRVLLADKYGQRSLESLQNCWNHQHVTTFDTTTKSLTPSAISHYHTSNPVLLGKKTYTLTAESGRNVTATEDHPFYTPEGWKEAKNLTIGDRVAIYPSLDMMEEPQLPTHELGYSIVQEKTIQKNYQHRHQHYSKELHKQELLPLTTNNYKIEIIARLLGHLFSDGHCGKNNLEFYLGSNEDAQQLAADIKLLGFQPSKITKKHTHITTKKGIINYTTYLVTKGGALHALLVEAGAPVGKKTDQPLTIPQWLFNASKSVKREFLAALLGGDGPKPRVVVRKDRKTGSKLHFDSYLFHKKEELQNNVADYAKDIQKLFNQLGVKIKTIRIQKDYTRKDGVHMFRCELQFDTSSANIQRLLTSVGYRYCLQKEHEANSLGEWLRIREQKINIKKTLKNTVQTLYSQGKTPKEISTALGITYRVVNGWLYERSRYEQTRLTQTLLPPYAQWLAQTRIGNSGAVWQKITAKHEEEIHDVRDFTTTEQTHTLIANGFIAHNCPIETPEGTSIGLRKNLALMSTVSRGEVQEEKLKKALEGCGLKLA